ncbi:hypothetical protein ACS0PU_001856 [Formica fusca]
MNTYWNMLYLEHPPYATWSIKSSSVKEAGVNIDVCKFVLDLAIFDLESMDILHKEAAALSRLIYRMKNKFRNDKGLRSMVALNKALINYHNMALLKEYKDLRSIIEMEDGTYILPSKQMLEYVLVRTQGFAKLMCKIENTAKYAAHFLKARINLGHAWSIALIAYATVSRIWFCSRHTLKKCCNWYDRLYICSKNFKHVGLPWIPKNQSLPCNLRLWLSLDWLNVDMSMHDTTEEKIFDQFTAKASDNTNEINFNASNKFKIDSLKLSQENASTHNVSSEESDDDDINDIGEVIARGTFEKSLPKVLPNTENPLSRKRKHVNINNEEKTMRKRRIK